MLAHEEAAEHFARALEVLERFRPDDARAALRAAAAASARRGCAPASGRWRGGRSGRRRAIAAALGDARAWPGRRSRASRRYIQPPGVVDEELIALLEQALELTAGERTVTRVRAADPAVRSALLRRPARADAGAGRRGDRDRRPSSATAEARALAAAARRRAYWGPEHLRRRLSDSTELLTLGQAGRRSRAHASGPRVARGRSARAGRAGCGRRADRRVQRRRRAAAPAACTCGTPRVWRAMRALLAGRLEDAERLAAEALALGAAAETVTAPQYYAIQLLAIRREQARMAELEAPARQLVASNPHRVAWRAALAALLAETGHPEQARAELRALAQRGPRRDPSRRGLADGDDAARRRLPPTLGDAGAAVELLRAARPVSGGERRDRPRRRVPRFRRAVSRPAGRHHRASGSSRPSTSSARSRPTRRSTPRSGSPTPGSTTPACSARPSRASRELAAASVAVAETLGLEKVLRRARRPARLRTLAGAACRGRYPAVAGEQDPRHRGEAVGRTRPGEGAAGRVHQARGLPRGAGAHRHLGGRATSSSSPTPTSTTTSSRSGGWPTCRSSPTASSSSCATNAPRSR